MPRIRIRELRKRKRVAQRELGDYMGVGQSTVSAWERGQRSPEIDQLEKLSDFFEVTVDYLLGFDSKFQDGQPDGHDDSKSADGRHEEVPQEPESGGMIVRVPNSIDISPEGLIELFRFYEYVKNAYPAKR